MTEGQHNQVVGALKSAADVSAHLRKVAKRARRHRRQSMRVRRLRLQPELNLTAIN